MQFTITGTVIEIFESCKTKKQKEKREFGIEYFEGRMKQAKFTCIGNCYLIDFKKGDNITVEFSIEPWRNENQKEPLRPFYNHEFLVINIES